MLTLDPQQRSALWQQVTAAVEAFLSQVGDTPVAPLVRLEDVRARLAPVTFEQPMTPAAAVDFALNGLNEHQLHAPHPRYFGLFNPAPTVMGIAADTVVAAYNPQLASWSHSPFPAEVERHVISALGRRFGFHPADIDGTFTSGGAEANQTAVLTALTHHFPDFRQGGLRSLATQPVLYVSAEAHHSFHKAARVSGLGSDAVRSIPTTTNLKMDVHRLTETLARDRSEGRLPFLIVGTAGTTNAGVIDPLAELAAVSKLENVWYHVDAAWGGAASLVPELRHLLDGIEQADSITFDAHKWLSVPMGAGIYCTRHPAILDQTFDMAASYMPRETETTDPYRHSLQWSRRFIGLKVFLSLAVAGWDGYAAVLRHQTAMGRLLRQELERTSWDIVNETDLPVVCFVDKQDPAGQTASFLDGVARHVVASGEAWLSTTRVGSNRAVLRACVTNYRTQASDIERLVQSLSTARTALQRERLAV